MGYYVHSVPGRIRVRIPEIRHQTHLCREITEEILNHRGVHAVGANPVTGSVKIQYDPSVVDEQHFLNLLQYCGYFDAEKAVDLDRTITSSATRTGQAFGRAVVSWAVGRALESNGLGLLAALI